MRQPSLFVTLLLYVTSLFLISTSLLMGNPLAALVIFVLFFLLWMLLQVQRDPYLEQQKTRNYFRIVTITGVVVVMVSLVRFGMTMLEGDYSAALHKLTPALFPIWIAWRFRKQWPRWVIDNKAEPRTAPPPQ